MYIKTQVGEWLNTNNVVVYQLNGSDIIVKTTDADLYLVLTLPFDGDKEKQKAEDYFDMFVQRVHISEDDFLEIEVDEKEQTIDFKRYDTKIIPMQIKYIENDDD